MSRTSPSRSRDVLYNLVGSAFFLGLSPVAPGSFGALVGVAYAIGVFQLLPPAGRPWAIALGLGVVAALNHLLTPWAVRYWHDEDPKHFVLDEVAGYLVVPLLMPRGTLWEVAFWGFFLFRILDVIKVPPARQIDRSLHGSWGILLDDIVSGLYAVVCLYAYRALGAGLF